MLYHHYAEIVILSTNKIPEKFSAYIKDVIFPAEKTIMSQDESANNPPPFFFYMTKLSLPPLLLKQKSSCPLSFPSAAAPFQSKGVGRSFDPWTTLQEKRPFFTLQNAWFVYCF